MDRAELTTEQVLKRDIPWETYMSTKLITGTCLQLLRRYDKRPESQRASLLDDDGPAYIRVFVNILHDISKEETVEYVLALIDEMLTANPHRARLFHDKSVSTADTYEALLRLLWRGNWFISEKSCKLLSLIASVRPKTRDAIATNGEASNSKSTLTTVDDVLKGLVDWLCSQVVHPFFLHFVRSTRLRPAGLVLGDYGRRRVLGDYEFSFLATMGSILGDYGHQRVFGDYRRQPDAFS